MAILRSGKARSTRATIRDPTQNPVLRDDGEAGLDEQHPSDRLRSGLGTRVHQRRSPPDFADVVVVARTQPGAQITEVDQALSDDGVQCSGGLVQRQASRRIERQSSCVRQPDAVQHLSAGSCFADSSELNAGSSGHDRPLRHGGGHVIVGDARRRPRTLAAEAPVTTAQLGSTRQAAWHLSLWVKGTQAGR